MAKRILPYRDYSEHDVLNLFSLDTSAYTIANAKSDAAAGEAFDSGVVVKVKTGELPGDMNNADSGLATSGDLRDYLGASPTSAHIGYNAYPYNGMTVEPADAGEVAVGITLRETLAYDENGEKLLYYKQKLDEAQAVLPGQTVPVLTRGLVLLDSNAVTGDPAVGAQLEVATDGTLVADTSAGNAMVATVLAKSGSDKFLCKISF
jgi:hypothetical protein